MMRRAVHLFVLLMSSTVLPAYAQSPCKAAAAHGIRDCQAQRVALYAGDWQGRSRVVSDVFRLEPTRLYWACCVTDLANNPLQTLQRGSYLVVLPDQRYSAETVLENCAAAIDSSVDQRSTEVGDSVWAPEGHARAMIVGWSDPQLADRSAVCRGPPVQLDAARSAVGAVLVVSVPANAIPEGK